MGNPLHSTAAAVSANFLLAVPVQVSHSKKYTSNFPCDFLELIANLVNLL